jgi:hypothetical protein
MRRYSANRGPDKGDRHHRLHHGRHRQRLDQRVEELEGAGDALDRAQVALAQQVGERRGTAVR